MTHVLMIALQFAPVQSTGAYRSIAFAQRLADHGIRPTVLTIDPEDGASIFGGLINPALAEPLKDKCEIVTLKDSKPLIKESPRAQLWRMLTTLDDTFERRFTPALDKALAGFAKEGRRFDLVYASAPPFGASMLGKRAAEQLKLPYLLDMRDAWAQWSPSPQTTRLHYLRKRRDETVAFQAADHIVGVTQDLVDLFAASHPDLPKSRFHAIPNGIADLSALPQQASWDPSGETVDIGYVGNFYWTPAKAASLKSPHRYLQYDPGTEDWSYRSPLYFFRAWQALGRKAPERSARLRFHHVGATPDWLPAMAAQHGLAERCVFHGRLPRQEVAGFLERMNGLLATSMKRIGGRDYCLASKSFEYVTSGKPILAFVCEGAQKSFFEEAGGAVVFDPDSLEQNADVLSDMLDQPRSLPLDPAYLAQYGHAETAAKMAALMQRCAASQEALPHVS